MRHGEQIAWAAARDYSLELACDLGDAFTIKAGGFQITLNDFVNRGIRGCLHHGTGKGAYKIDVIAFCRFAIGLHQTDANPDAAMLHGQGNEVVNRRVLVTVHGGRIGETAKNLVFPLLSKPGFGAGIGKFLELPSSRYPCMLVSRERWHQRHPATPIAPR